MKLCCVFCWQNTYQNAFFHRHFVPVRQKVPKVCRTACHVTLRRPVKFCSNRFRFAGVIPEKVICYEYSIGYMPSVYNKRVLRLCGKPPGWLSNKHCFDCCRVSMAWPFQARMWIAQCCWSALRVLCSKQSYRIASSVFIVYHQQWLTCGRPSALWVRWLRS